MKHLKFLLHRSKQLITTQLHFFSNARDVLSLIFVLASPLLEESGNHRVHKVFKIAHFVFLKNYNIQVLVAHYTSPFFQRKQCEQYLRYLHSLQKFGAVKNFYLFKFKKKQK